MSGLKAANLALRFLLELCLLAALAAWAYHLPAALIIRLGAAALVVLAVAALWGVLLSPRRSVHWPATARLVLEVALFALAVAGLAAIGQPLLAAALGGVYALNKGLILLWKQG